MGVNSETIYNFSASVFFFIILNTIPSIYSGYIGHQFILKISNSDLYRNLFLFLAIWLISSFADDDTADKGTFPDSLYRKIVLTVLIFIFVLMFSRQTAIFNAIELLLLVAMFVIYEVKNHYEDGTVDSSEKTDTINTLINITYGIWGAVGVILLIGYYKYMLLKMKQKGSNFRMLKFIFGKREIEYSNKAPYHKARKIKKRLKQKSI